MNKISKDNDKRSYEEIAKGWKENGFLLGRLMSDEEQREAQKNINLKSEKEKAKRQKRLNKEFRQKPAFLVFVSGGLEKILHFIVTIYSMAIFINIFFVWQIYKAFSVSGIQGILHTKYTLFVIIYFTVLFVLKQIYYFIYKYHTY